MAEQLYTATSRGSDDQRMVGALKRIADARWGKWHAEHKREFEQSLESLHHQGLSALGRAARRQQLFEDFYRTAIKARIAIYYRVAQEKNCLAMFAKPELDRLQDEIMTSAHFARLTLEDTNARDFGADGNTSPVAVTAVQVRVMREFESRILDVVNAEMGPLRAEGEATALDRGEIEERDANLTSERPPQQSRTVAATCHRSPRPSMGVHPEFPKRAEWLRSRLRERSWNKHDLAMHGGPNHKTTQKLLDGLDVRADVIEKVVTGLSARGGVVTPMDIPLE